MGLIIAICCWWLFGICGYFMMRQGSLVEFEKELGKKGAWDIWDILLAAMYTLYGPMAILYAFCVYGKSCFRKR